MLCTPRSLAFIALALVACGRPSDDLDRSQKNDVRIPPGIQGHARPDGEAESQATPSARAARRTAISREAIASYGGAELPITDPNCRGMKTQLADIDPIGNARHRAYFDGAIPRVVHRLHARKDSQDDPWALWAQAWGYAIETWHHNDVASLLSDEDQALVAQLLEEGNLAAVANIGAYHILARRGGIFVADDVQPPSAGLKPSKDWLDLSNRLPMTGILLATHAHFRDVGLCSATATTRFMASSPEHPLMAHLAATVGINARSQRKCLKCSQHARYISGSAFLSRNFIGVFHLVTHTYLAELNMWPMPFPDLNDFRKDRHK